MTGREELRERIARVLYQRWTPTSEWSEATAPGVWLSDADAVPVYRLRGEP